MSIDTIYMNTDELLSARRSARGGGGWVLAVSIRLPADQPLIW